MEPAPLLVAGWVVRAPGAPPAARPTAEPSHAPALAFAAAAGGLVAVAHLAWLFDWGGTATGSSTAALLFVVLPILALVAGAGAWAAARLVRRAAA